MKRFYLFFLIFTAIFESCSNLTENNSTITNSSSKMIIFSLPSYGDCLYSLPAGASMSKDMYSYPSCNIQNPKNAVIYKSEKYGITFYDRTSNIHSYIITNINTFDVIVTEQYGYIGDNGDAVSIKGNSSVTIKVYTSNPIFTAKDSNGNVVNILYQIGS